MKGNYRDSFFIKKGAKIDQEDTNLNIDRPKINSSNCKKQTMHRMGETDPKNITMGEFNSHPSQIDHVDKSMFQQRNMEVTLYYGLK